MREGGVILYPTDTVWGIGCDATNEDAVRRVYEIKQRQDRKGGFLCSGCPGSGMGLDRFGRQTVDYYLFGRT